MASSGAVRPAVSRVLQRYQLSSCGNSSSSPLTATLPIRPLCARPSQTAAERSSSSPARWQQQQQQQPRAPFTTSASLEQRKTRDRSKLRGVSTIHRSGPKEPLSVSGEGIPVPDLSPEAGRMREEDNDPEHGLWGFFYEKRLLATPEEDAAHGRAWTVQELRGKSWDDLHGLWWACCRERNRIATSNHARGRFDIGFGDKEAAGRDTVTKRTMQAIRHVLTERYYSWEDATKLAKEDPEIDLSGNGPVYTPSTYLEEDVAEATIEGAAAGEKHAELATGSETWSSDKAPSAAAIDAASPPPTAKSSAEAPRA